MEYILFSTQQMKYVFCKKLAAYLCMKPSPSPSLEPPLNIYRRRESDVSEVHYSNSPRCNDMATRAVPAMKSEAADRVLQEVLELLKTRVQKEDEQSYEADSDDEIKHAWMLAAAVLDRICAIAFAVVLIGGTVVFFTIIINHP